jgi:RNA:NAD 2'-phosphotransferase (TPT1/KptA family)
MISTASAVLRHAGHLGVLRLGDQRRIHHQDVLELADQADPRRWTLTTSALPEHRAAEGWDGPADLEEPSGR